KKDCPRGAVRAHTACDVAAWRIWTGVASLERCALASVQRTQRGPSRVSTPRSWAAARVRTRGLVVVSRCASLRPRRRICAAAAPATWVYQNDAFVGAFPLLNGLVGRRSQQLAKRDVDPQLADRALLGDTVHVVVLDAPAHEQQAAILEFELELAAVSRAPRLEDEAPRSPERDRCDRGVYAQLGFIVSVVAHAVLAVAVEVPERVVERARRVSRGRDARLVWRRAQPEHLLFDQRAKPRAAGRPSARRECFPGVPVG